MAEELVELGLEPFALLVHTPRPGAPSSPASFLLQGPVPGAAEEGMETS